MRAVPRNGPSSLQRFSIAPCGVSFPEALDVVEIAQVPNPPGMRLRGLEKLEEDAAKRLTHAARAVFNDCMLSP